MRRPTRVAIFAAAAVTAAALHAPAASGPLGSPGPFWGIVVQGQTNPHLYAAPPPPKECILPVTYTVTLRYAPPTDVLRLTVHDISSDGSNGFASVSFEDACWTQFPIFVTGVDVAAVSVYEVDVREGPAAS